MKSRILQTTSLALCLSAAVTACMLQGCVENEVRHDRCQYTPWGVDEYEFFGLTQPELAKQFKGKLYFSDSFSKATFSEPGNGYQGPVFNLSYRNGRVSSVGACFKGCRANNERSLFESKEEALNYAIDNLSDYRGESERESLAKAKLALAELKQSTSQHSQSH